MEPTPSVMITSVDNNDTVVVLTYFTLKTFPAIEILVNTPLTVLGDVNEYGPTPPEIVVVFVVPGDTASPAIKSIGCALIGVIPGIVTIEEAFISPIDETTDKYLEEPII